MIETLRHQETLIYPTPKIEYIQSLDNKGKGISLRKLAVKWDMEVRKLFENSRLEGWVKSREQFLSKLSAKLELKLTDTVAKMNERHIQEYQFIQKKAIDAIKLKDFEAAKEAVSALDIGIKGERLARGEPTEVVQVEDRVARILELVERANRRREQAIQADFEEINTDNKSSEKDIETPPE